MIFTGRWKCRIVEPLCLSPTRDSSYLTYQNCRHMPNAEKFREFFRQAEQVEPYPFQETLAGEEIQSRAICVPTGAGKTAAVVLAWLWRLRDDPGRTPRRLVYCLPMRTLVEQTRDKARKWRDRVAPDLEVYTLMGGEVGDRWEVEPERPAILVGTQDMLLSRALNRGYAMSRYKWPVDFGLLNNDCLWVCDEVQLMGSGLGTTTQLQAWREEMGGFGPRATWWMSATMDTSHLATVDAVGLVDALRITELGNEDRSNGGLAKRLNAPKKLTRAPESCQTAAGIAQFVIDNHAAGSQSLVILNRVARARETYDALNRIAKQSLDIRLLHSRFRGHERLGWSKLLSDGIPAGGRVLVATQVVEAGVDISSALLVTDLAPYTGLVQRFGRCNRAGELDEGRIFWVDRTGEEASPYEPEDLEQSRSLIAELDSARINDLPRPPDGFEHGDIIRRRDLLDLFDTTRDLSGYDIDISRFIREGDERDVMVAWRELPDEGPAPKTVTPTSDELCAVPIGEFRKFLDKALKNKKRREAWTWSAIDREWKRVTAQDAELLRPGMILIVDTKAGGYDVERGWDFESLVAVPVVPTDGAKPEVGMYDDPLTNQKYRQTVMAHSREVRSQAELIAGKLDNIGVSGFVDDLLYASLRHDVGKCHRVFQESLHRQLTADEATRGLFLAKTEFRGRHSRPHFRHELASALALLQMGAPDLAVYLTACHHGKVRLSIRAMPGETKPDKPDVRFARGIHEGDSLPEVDLGGGVVIPSIVLDLEPMLLGMSEDGQRSWLDRMIGLRDRMGVFRLAYLEGLIRAADARASAKPVEVL